MRLRMRTGAARWLAVVMVLSVVGVSRAQVDPAKALVGRWEGEQEYLVISADNPRMGGTGRPPGW
jgi:hypothetical protein